MSIKKGILLYALIMVLFQFLLNSCKEEKQNPPTLETYKARSITINSALGGGVVYNDGNVGVTCRGLVWSTKENPTVEDNDSSTYDDTWCIGSFYTDITNLKPGTKYYIKVYCKSDLGTLYGNQVEFTTLDGKALITTKDASKITAYSVTTGGNITYDGGTPITAYGIVWSRNELPTITDNEGYTSDGNGTAAFESKISGLTPETKYYVRAYATNSVTTQYGNQISFSTTPADKTFGNLTYNDFTYKTVYIGGREWMTENLRTTKFNDGSSIAEVQDNSAWTSLSTPAYCWYNSDQENYGVKYGALYNWYTVSTDKLCPVGWHVPTNEDWNDLVEYVGGKYIAGSKLKATSGWYLDHNGSDSCGFNALPGGDRYSYNGEFLNVLTNGSWWTSTPESESYIWTWSMTYGCEDVLHGRDNPRYGHSIRCIKDL